MHFMPSGGFAAAPQRAEPRTDSPAEMARFEEAFRELDMQTTPGQRGLEGVKPASSAAEGQVSRTADAATTSTASDLHRFDLSHADTTTDALPVGPDADFDATPFVPSAAHLRQTSALPPQSIAARPDALAHSPPAAEESTQPRIGADTIPAQAAPPASVTERAADNEALARTAGALLENVKDERAAKFQRSSFMGLMRQLRDREVTVEGDRVISTAPADQGSAPPAVQPDAQTHPGGRDYPAEARAPPSPAFAAAMLREMEEENLTLRQAARVDLPRAPFRHRPRPATVEDAASDEDTLAFQQAPP